jgi:hypothetical protein
LLDDLGSGLEFLDDHEEAIRVLRGKLEQQESHGFEGRQLYTTYANLGTFLIHGSFAKARSGDPAAKKNLREGLDFIRKSIAVNPQAHFGRETWQAAAVEYMLAAIENPALVLKYDMIGDRLDQVVDPSQTHWGNAERWGGMGMNRDAAHFLEHSTSGTSPNYFRSFITRVGAEQGWKEAGPTSHTKPVPFDEPALGIIGMWRLGGGANPHFGLALGEIMMRVGQRYLAWTSYERATQMAERFWPEPSIQQRFVYHCRDRQRIIEGELPNEDWKGRRKQFDDELNFGRSYQKAYQDYEAKRIEEGASIDDPDFYRAFHAEHGPIASLVGDEDRYLVRGGGLGLHIPYAAMVLFSGIFAIGTSWVLRSANKRSQDEAKVSGKPV